LYSELILLESRATNMPGMYNAPVLSDRRHFPLLVLLAALFAMTLGVAAWFTLSGQDRQAGRPAIEGFLWPAPRTLQPFSLSDHHGRPFGLDRLRGRWSLLFFGYTHCPDVCPTTLQTLKYVKQALGPRDDAQYLFVTIDPERDTPAQLAAWVDFFDPEFIGLTGDMTNIKALTGQLGIMHMTGDRRADGMYDVDHSAAVLLTDPEGRFVGVFSAPHEAASIAGRYTSIRKFMEQQ